MLLRVLVLGGDGYLGWPAALHFSARGHDVAVVDSYVRRRYDIELGTESLVPIWPLPDRLTLWHAETGKHISLFCRGSHRRRIRHIGVAAFRT